MNLKNMIIFLRNCLADKLKMSLFAFSNCAFSLHPDTEN
jgi:hypothetical protein